MLSKIQHPDEQVENRLRSDKYAWLMTVRKDNRPHSVPIGFLWDGKTILIISQPETQKIRNLRLNPQMILSLADLQSGGSLATVEGTAELSLTKTSQFFMEEPELARGYAEKYAEDIQSAGLTFETLVADYSQLIRITPTRFLLHS